MKISLMQLACQEGEIAANLAAIEAAWQKVPLDVDIVVFPELMLTGFAEAGESERRALRLDAPELAQLSAMSRARNQAATIGFLQNDNGKIYNATAFFTPEAGLQCLYRKTHLWDEEQDLICAGDEYVCTTWRNTRLGFITCFDIEFPEPARHNALLGCEVLLVCDGNMDPYLPVHQLAAPVRAMENQMFVCLANRVGEGMGFHFSGGSLACAPDGSVLAESDAKEGILTVTLSLAALAQSRQTYDYLKQMRTHYPNQAQQHPLYDTWSIK